MISGSWQRTVLAATDRIQRGEITKKLCSAPVMNYPFTKSMALTFLGPVLAGQRLRGAKVPARPLSHKKPAQWKIEKNLALQGGDGRADVLYLRPNRMYRNSTIGNPFHRG